MGNNREFEIAYVGLKLGSHVYTYNIEDNFFESYGQQDFVNCNTNIKLNIDKNSGFIQLHFDIDGTVDVDCDRCGNTMRKQLCSDCFPEAGLRHAGGLRLLLPRHDRISRGDRRRRRHVR